LHVAARPVLPAGAITAILVLRTSNEQNPQLEIFRSIIDCLDDLKGLYASAPDDGGSSVTILAWILPTKKKPGKDTAAT
jgi:hypothetical protein